VKAAVSGTGSFKRGGYNAALKGAIYEFHRSNSPASARASLAQRLKKFIDESRKQEARDGLDNYILWHKQSGVLVADHKIRIAMDLGNGVLLGGEFSRLDVSPTNDTYTALLIAANASMNQSELRWPLVQKYIADSYGRPVEKVNVGVQDLFSHGLAVKSFSKSQIARAVDEATELADEVTSFLLDL
jgi:hypothetical protein